MTADARVHPRQRRARIEPEPAEREDERAEHGHRDVVAGDRLRLAVACVLADARPQHPRPDQRGGAAHQVDHRAAREVDVAVAETEVAPQLRQPPAAPHPVRVDRVGDPRDHEAEDHERREAPAFGHRPGRDRRGRVHEHHLEQEQRRDRRRVDRRRQEETLRAPQTEVLAGDGHGELARQGRVVAERGQRADAAHLQPEPERPEADDADRVDEEVHPHRVGDVLGAGQARLHQREPRLHEHHHEAAEQRPGDVERGLTGLDLRLNVGQLLGQLGDGWLCHANTSRSASARNGQDVVSSARNLGCFRVTAAGARRKIRESISGGLALGVRAPRVGALRGRGRSLARRGAVQRRAGFDDHRGAVLLARLRGVGAGARDRRADLRPQLVFHL